MYILFRSHNIVSKDTSVPIIYPVSTVDEMKSIIRHPETLKGGKANYTNHCDM